MNFQDRKNATPPSISFIFEHKLADSDFKIRVRISQKADLKTLCRLETLAWSEEQRAPDNMIEARFKTHPKGFLIAENTSTGDPLGFVFLVPVSDFDENSELIWQKYSDLGVIPQLDQNCQYMYAVSISTSSLAPRGVGTIIMKAASEWCKFSGVKKLAWGARIPKFRSAFKQGISISEYFKGILNGSVREEVTGVAIGSGGKLIRPLPDYYDDPESMNYGILVVHDFSK